MQRRLFIAELHCRMEDVAYDAARDLAKKAAHSAVSPMSHGLADFDNPNGQSWGDNCDEGRMVTMMKEG